MKLWGPGTSRLEDVLHGSKGRRARTSVAPVLAYRTSKQVNLAPQAGDPRRERGRMWGHGATVSANATVWDWQLSPQFRLATPTFMKHHPIGLSIFPPVSFVSLSLYADQTPLSRT